MRSTARNSGKTTSRNSNAYRRRDGAGLKNRLTAAAIPVFAALTWVVLVGGISFGLLYSYRWVTRSPIFTLREIDLRGNTYLSRDEVIAGAGLEVGQNVLALNIARVQSRLTENPWVASARVKRVLPDRLILTLAEREAAFWVRSGTDLFYADRFGEPIGPVEPDKFISLPFLVVEGGDRGESQALDDLIRQLQGRRFPFSDRDVAWVKVASTGMVSIFLEAHSMLVILDGREVRQAAAHVHRVWMDLLARNELSRARMITVFGGRAWVEFSSG